MIRGNVRVQRIDRPARTDETESVHATDLCRSTFDQTSIVPLTITEQDLLFAERMPVAPHQEATANNDQAAVFEQPRMTALTIREQDLLFAGRMSGTSHLVPSIELQQAAE